MHEQNESLSNKNHQRKERRERKEKKTRKEGRKKNLELKNIILVNKKVAE